MARPVLDFVNILWSYQAEGALLCSAISSDGQYVAAGSQDGSVYLFERSGKLLWRQQVEKNIFRLALAENHGCVLVGCAGSFDARVWKAYLWNYAGTLLQTFEVDGEILGAGITPEADLIALGTFHNSLYLFDGSGHRLWHKQLEGPVRQLSFTPDGQYIAVGGDDCRASLFDQTGNECWHYLTGDSIFTGARTDATASHTILGSNDQGIYLLDHTGQRLWRYPTGGNVNVVAITPDGRYMGGAGNAHTVFLFHRSGELLWSYKAEANIYDLGISHDGEFVVAGTSDNQTYLFDKQGRCLWRRKVGDRVRSVSMTPNGRLFITASQDRSLVLYENLSASDDLSVRWASNLVIRRVRHVYLQNPYQGLSSWFDEFDSVLRQRAFAVCEALLREIREQGYPLKEREVAYIDSREAALLLCQGLSLHRRQDYEAALQCYLRCQQIQQRLKHTAGEEQVDVALSELKKQAESDAKVQRILLSAPHVMGNGSEVLAARLADETSPVERQRMLLAAKEAGYFSLLTQETVAGEPDIQASAALALSWLRPGPGNDALLRMLASPDWIVRWQAISLFLQRATERPESFAEHSDSVREAVALCLEKGEFDPSVRRAAAELLGKIGTTSESPVLLPLLQDQDVDVRFAAVSALGQFGDRRVLPALRDVQNGEEMRGTMIKDRAKEALEGIENRYPIFEVKTVTFCREFGGQNQPVRPGTIFLAAAGTMYCVATLSLAQPGQHVSCAWYENSRLLEEQTQTLDEPSSSPSPVVSLIELLDNEGSALPKTDGPAVPPHLRNIVFSFTPKKAKWSPGNYFVQVTLEGAEPRRERFSIIDQIAIESAQTCMDLDGNGRFLLPLQVFPQMIASIHCRVILKEAPIDAEVEGTVYHVGSNRRVEGAPIRARVTGEGRGAQVLLKYTASKLEVGSYSIVLKTSTGSRKNCNFSILRPQDFFAEP